MNNESLKKLAVIVAVSIGIFWMLKPKLNEDDQNPFANRENGKKTGFIRKPQIDDEQVEHDHIRMAYNALCIYIDALNAKENEEVLSGIRQSMRDEIYMEIYQDASGNYIVRDLDGNDVLRY